MTISPHGPRHLGNDAQLFALALLKARAGAASPEAATDPSAELLSAYEERLGEHGMRLLAVHLAELTVELLGSGPDTVARLEALEMDLLTRQQTG
ncbi:hypothetical protein ABT095_30820 [Kitasatospora sp. NPDC002227]|uniref:hypothetical protein n=1 Tax=Kitasatospora sp. NPDC002227 TaxID=3154773 RepID=UPI00332EFCF1